MYPVLLVVSPISRPKTIMSAWKMLTVFHMNKDFMVVRRMSYAPGRQTPSMLASIRTSALAIQARRGHQVQDQYRGKVLAAK